MNKVLISIFLFCCVQCTVVAKGVYQTSEQFIVHAFNGDMPSAKVLWLSKEDKLLIAEIMQHKFNRLRLRYWRKNNETVWVLDEIGKEKPITIGIHINKNMIVELKVLAFRESRGDEVRHEFFTSQFRAASTDEKNMLNQHIDGITGATMSVRALTKVARLALWLHKKVLKKQ
ncbi:MAG: hypothetical protein ACI9LM_000766 [Alteromonadaceae bacterium]